MLIRKELHQIIICWGLCAEKISIIYDPGRDGRFATPRKFFERWCCFTEGRIKTCRLSQGHLQIKNIKQTHQNRCASRPKESAVIYFHP